MPFLRRVTGSKLTARVGRNRQFGQHQPMSYLPCPTHPEYDGFGDPPDPDCDQCDEIAQDVA